MGRPRPPHDNRLRIAPASRLATTCQSRGRPLDGAQAEQETVGGDGG